MPLTITIEDDTGERVDAIYDEHDWLVYLIEETRQPNAPCPRILDYVDQVGDTLFNHKHLPRLLQEIELIRTLVDDPVAHEWLEAFSAFVTICQQQRHYLKLYGD